MTIHLPSKASLQALAAHSAWLDALVLTVVGATLLAGAAYFDFGETVSEWIARHEAWKLDELTLVLDLLFVGLAWFALRRWREATREIRRREAASEEVATRAAEKSESEERLRLALEAGRVIAWERDIATGLMTRSPNAADITSITHGSPDAFDSRVHPDDRMRHDQAVNLALTEGRSYTVEVRFLRDDGQTIWLHNRARVSTRSDGRRILVGTSTDVTAQKNAEINLQHSEERLRLATEAAGLGTYIINIRTGEREWSQGMRGILGISPDAPIGREPYNQILHPDDREKAEADFEQRIGRADEPLEAQYRIIRADTGEERWVSEFSRALTDEDGQPVRLVGILRDVTREKEAELALRDSEEQFRLLAENATDVIFRTSLDGKRLYLSPSCLPAYGYRPEELIGTDATYLMHPDDITRVKADLEAMAAAEPGHETTVYRIRHKAGHWVWLEARRWLVRDENGNLVELAGIARDISERRKLEEQLRQSQKMEVVGQLTGGIAHDFNNLLTVVIGNIEMLVERITNPQDRALAQMVQEAAERGASLTQHLLAFGRRQTLKPERLDLCEVVKDLVPLLRRTMGEHIEIVTELGQCEPIAVADRTLLESALLNRGIL